MESIWTGAAEDSFFDSDTFDKYRVVQYAESKNSLKAGDRTYYTVSVDVGRLSDFTIVSVIKATPQANGAAIKTLVTIIPIVAEHFEVQSIKVKRICEAFNAAKLIIDGNGLGVGLLDYLVKPNIDVESGVEYPSFGVDYQNEDQEKMYKKFETPSTRKDMIFIIKATPQINSDMHVNVISQMSSGKLRFLIDHQVAKTKLLATKKGQDMNTEQRSEYLSPYTNTSMLKEEMSNLRAKRDNEGKVALEKVNKRMRKDRFSSFEMGLYYIKLKEEEHKQNKFNLAQFIIGTKSTSINKQKRKSKVYTRRVRN